jgi:cbb3-type cytochrome oxidase cytochrome c subunit
MYCFGRKSKLNSTPEAEENIALVRLDVKYPANTVQKSTQCYVDRVDKKLQAGNPDPRREDKKTQITLIGEINVAMMKANHEGGPDVLIGSAERYSNPRYTVITHLGKPPVVPLSKTPSAKELEETYAKVSDAYKQVVAGASSSSSELDN